MIKKATIKDISLIQDLAAKILEQVRALSKVKSFSHEQIDFYAGFNVVS